ncbi:MAG: M20/M25/M40 family metallo-hydrolase [Clostridia bacterium]
MSRYAETLSKMISFKTISTKENKYMSEVLAFNEFMKTRFPNIVKKCVWENRDGAILIKLAGKSSAEPLVVMSHLDVADVENQNWQKPAFSGEIADGMVWGRGSVDTKGSLCAMFEALEELIIEKVTPQQDIYIFSSSREEIAGEDCPNVVKYFKENGIVPKLVVDEGGAMLDNPINGVSGRFAMIAMSERARAKVLLTFNSTEKMSAYEQSQKAVKKLNKVKLSKMDFCPEVEAMFSALVPYMKFPMKTIFKHINIFKGLVVSIVPKVSREARAMFGSTLGFSGVEEKNINDKKLVLTVTVGSTYYSDINKSTQNLTEILKKMNIEYKIDSVMQTVKPEPVGSEGFVTVSNAILKTFEGKVQPSPFIIFGGTDARHFVGYAKSVIRFVPLLLTQKQFSSVHKENEYLMADTLDGAVAFYKTLMKDFK